jgi:hypothetical protein
MSLPRAVADLAHVAATRNPEMVLLRNAVVDIVPKLPIGFLFLIVFGSHGQGAGRDDDFQSPAKLVVAAGTVAKDDRGDLQGDGFNEGEECYVVRVKKVATLVAESLARHQPAIKFLECGVEGIPDLLVGGKLAAREHCNLAWTAPKNLLLQWCKVIEGGETIRFELK